MKTAHRLVSLSVLGAMAIAIAPVAGAQGFGFRSQGRGHFGFGSSDIDAETRAEIRVELEACKENNEDDREAMKTCADAVLASYGIERPERPEISDDIRAELKACREENVDDHEAAKACADAVFETNGIERPERDNKPGRRIGHRLHSHIEETCGEREDTDEWKECAQENRPERGGLFNSTDLRAELRACLDLEDNEELRECVFGVRAQIRANLQ